MEQQRKAVGVGCVSTEEALTHGIVAITLSPSKSSTPPSRLVAGMAPDGTRAVIAHTRGRATKTPVGDEGVFVLRDHAFNPPDQLTLVPGGEAR
jgi:hypothetical protein